MSKYKQIRRVKYVRRILDTADACVNGSKNITKSGARSLLLQVSWPLTACEQRTLLFVLANYPLTRAACRALKFIVPSTNMPKILESKRLKLSNQKIHVTGMQSRGLKKQTCPLHRYKFCRQAQILTLPFYQKVKIFSFLDVPGVTASAIACRDMSGDLLEQVLSFIQRNLFVRYRAELRMRKCGQSNDLEPEEVARQMDQQLLCCNNYSKIKRASYSIRSVLCTMSSQLNASHKPQNCRNIWRLSRKLVSNAQKRAARSKKKKPIDLEEKCLRTAVVTWFNVNHDYLQEKLVCVPADYIENRQMQMRLHWRKLIVEWLFEVCNLYLCCQ